MFLSRVSAKPDDAFAYARLVGLTPYDAHQAVWSLFNDPSASRDFLFRRETAPAQACLMVLSTRIPQAASSVLRVDTKPFEPKLQVGDRLQFDVRANAVKTTHDGSGSARRVRRDIVEYALDQIKANGEVPESETVRQMAGQDWLRTQGERLGFELEHVNVSNHQFHRFKKTRSGSPICFSSLDLQGVLRVTDAAVFVSQALRQGIGRSRGFGCGLMLVKRC